MHIFAVLSICVAVVNCVPPSRPPRPPPTGAPRGTPVPMPEPVMPNDLTHTPKGKPPKGCSPGCGGTEICAELGRSYCSRSSMCSVCIKMSSIRFPASALAGMFTQSTKRNNDVQIQALPVTLPPVNPLSGSKNETEISIIEYAANQRNTLNINDNGANLPIGQTVPPPPPKQLANTYDVLRRDSQIVGIDINGVQDKQHSASVVQQPGINLGKVDAERVKYPIIVTVSEPGNTLSTASQALDQNNVAQITGGSSQIDAQQAAPEHLGHMDQTQMTKWYQQYKMFKKQQAQLNPSPSMTPAHMTDSFDYASFKQFQKWLQLNQQSTDQTTLVQTVPASGVPTQLPAIDPALQAKVQPLVPDAYQSLPTPVDPTFGQLPQGVGYMDQSALPVVPVPTQQQTGLDYAAIQQQLLQWQLQQQKQANSVAIQPQLNTVVAQPTVAELPSPPVQQSNTLGYMDQSALPVVPVPAQQQTGLDYAAIQQQLLQWQLQQQKQANSVAIQPQLNTVVAQPTVAELPSPPVQQSNTFDYAAFQKQYQQWQEKQALKKQKPKPAATPVFDYTALQQQWQQQLEQQNKQGPSTVTQQANALPDPNIQLLQQPNTQEIQNTIQQNPQTSQQENSYTYMPQQPANNFNDPFFYDQPQNTFSTNYYDPPQQNNNLMDLMMFSGLGFGGGLFGF